MLYLILLILPKPIHPNILFYFFGGIGHALVPRTCLSLPGYLVWELRMDFSAIQRLVTISMLDLISCRFFPIHNYACKDNVRLLTCLLEHCITNNKSIKCQWNING